MKRSNATTPVKVNKETNILFKNIVLEGVETLKALKITINSEVKRKFNPKTDQFNIVYKKLINEIVEPMEFNLVEVTPEQLKVYRKSGIPSFVLKVNGKFYYAEITTDINFVSANILGAHRCAIVGYECSRLCAASDEKGGCAKVRNYSRYIEKYPWIEKGYETFNTKQDAMVVVKCLRYKKCEPRKKRSTEEVNNAKLAIADLWYY